MLLSAENTSSPSYAANFSEKLMNGVRIQWDDASMNGEAAVEVLEFYKKTELVQKWIFIISLYSRSDLDLTSPDY